VNVSSRSLKTETFNEEKPTACSRGIDFFQSITQLSVKLTFVSLLQKRVIFPRLARFAKCFWHPVRLQDIEISTLSVHSPTSPSLFASVPFTPCYLPMTLPLPLSPCRLQAYGGICCDAENSCCLVIELISNECGNLSIAKRRTLSQPPSFCKVME